MKIKRYSNFSINENVSEDLKYDIDQIFVEFLQDYEFSLEIKERFFNNDKSKYENEKYDKYKIPALILSLTKKSTDISDISRSTIDNITSLTYECSGKLSDIFKDVQIHILSFNRMNEHVFINVKIVAFLES